MPFTASFTQLGLTFPSDLNLSCLVRQAQEATEGDEFPRKYETFWFSHAQFLKRWELWCVDLGSKSSGMELSAAFWGFLLWFPLILKHLKGISGLGTKWDTLAGPSSWVTGPKKYDLPGGDFVFQIRQLLFKA